MPKPRINVASDRRLVMVASTCSHPSVFYRVAAVTHLAPETNRAFNMRLLIEALGGRSSLEEACKSGIGVWSPIEINAEATFLSWIRLDIAEGGTLLRQPRTYVEEGAGWRQQLCT